MKASFIARPNPYSEQHENEIFLMFSDENKKQLISDINSLFLCYYDYVARRKGEVRSKEDEIKLLFIDKIANHAKKIKKNKETRQYEVIMQLETAQFMIDLYISTVNGAADDITERSMGADVELKDLPPNGLVN